MTAICGKAYARPYFFIERPKLGMNLSFEHDKVSIRNPHTDNEFTSNHYTEEFEIETRGWVYHPALFYYSLAYSPAWTQSRGQSNTGLRTTSSSFYNAYNADAVIMQYKPYSLRLFGSKEIATIRNNFSEKTTSENDVMGARFIFHARNFSSYLESVQKEKKRTGLFNSSQDSWDTSIGMSHKSKYTHTTLRSSYKDIATQSLDYLENVNRFVTLLDNSISTTDVSLRSILEYEETDRSSSRLRRYSIRETLDLNHGRQLSTSYNMDYLKTNYFDKTVDENDRSESKGVGFNLNHLLYNNLNTSIGADFSEYDSRTRRNSILSTDISWNYSRTIPWGSLNIDTGYLYSRLKNRVRSDTNSTSLVQDESITLTSGVIDLLTNDFVVTSTIRITELASFNGFGNTYVEGTDYDIESIGDRTRIIRKLGGNIVDGQTVFVEYRFIPSPPFDYSLFNQNYGISVNLWSSWNIYYQLSRSEQSFIEGPVPDNFVFLDRSVHSAGTEYNWKWSRTTFDWEDQYTTSSAYERWTANEIMTFRPHFNIFLTLSTSYGQTEIKESNLTVDVFSADSTIQWQLTNRSYLTVDGSWTDSSGDIQELTDLEFAARYQWLFRIWELYIEYEFDRARDKTNHQTFTKHHFMIELIRALF